MKVLCVNNNFVSLSLTVGKWYEVFDTQSHNYVIISDRGNKQRISRSFFMTLEELRNEKLNKLGIT